MDVRSVESLNCACVRFLPRSLLCVAVVSLNSILISVELDSFVSLREICRGGSFSFLCFAVLLECSRCDLLEKPEACYRRHL